MVAKWATANRKPSLTAAVTDEFVVSAASENCVLVDGIVMRNFVCDCLKLSAARSRSKVPHVEDPA